MCTYTPNGAGRTHVRPPIWAAIRAGIRHIRAQMAGWRGSRPDEEGRRDDGGGLHAQDGVAERHRSSASASSAAVQPPSGPTATVRSPGASGRPPGSAATADIRMSAAGAGPLISGSHTRRDCSAASTAIRRNRSSWRAARSSSQRTIERSACTSTSRSTPISVHFCTSQSRRSPLGGATAIVIGDAAAGNLLGVARRPRRAPRPRHTAATGRRRRSPSPPHRRAGAARLRMWCSDASSRTGAPTRRRPCTWAADRRSASSTAPTRTPT